jgi:hypothetical protein
LGRQFRQFVAVDVEGFHQIAHQRRLEFAGFLRGVRGLLFTEHAIADQSARQARQFGRDLIGCADVHSAVSLEPPMGISYAKWG